MKTRIFLSILGLALFVLASGTYSQQNCCENKPASCCTENKECCSENVSNELIGNAGGDSATQVGSVTCPVSGEPIEAAGGVKFDYYGTSYTFCCEGCLAKFKKEPMNYIKDEMVCPVMGEKIESKDVFVMHNDTKYYLCCQSCESKFKKNPEKYMNKKM